MIPMVNIPTANGPANGSNKVIISDTLFNPMPSRCKVPAAAAMIDADTRNIMKPENKASLR